MCLRGMGALEEDSHVRTELVEVPVAVLLHFVWRVDGQGPIGVHGDHHAADVRLQGGRHGVNVVRATSVDTLLPVCR